MRILFCLVLACGIVLMPAGCGKPVESTTARPKTAPPPPSAAQVQPAAPAPGGAQIPPGATLSAADEAAILAPINAALATYQQVQKRVPNDLNELLAKGTIKSLPPVPAGMKIYYDPITVSVSIARTK